VRRTVLARDGEPGQHSGDGTHVVYVHGYWFGADTLHTDQLLKRKRPQLTATLQEWIEPALLVVLGYGAWDDVLMTSLQTLVANERARPDIVWGFNGAEDPEVVAKLEAAGGRVQTYEYVDMHRLLPALRDRLCGGPGTARGGPVAGPEWLEEPYRTLPAGDVAVPGFRLLRAEHGVVEMSGREATTAPPPTPRRSSSTKRPPRHLDCSPLVVWSFSSIITPSVYREENLRVGKHQVQSLHFCVRPNESRSPTTPPRPAKAAAAAAASTSRPPGAAVPPTPT